MFKYIYLIIILSFTLAGDSLFSVAIIWRVLEQGGSAKALGVFLCLMMIITFMLQEGSKRFKSWLQKDPRKSFASIRAAGVCCSLAFLPLLWHESKIMLYLAGALFTVLSFYTMITVEAIMGQEVLLNRISSNKASRILQTAIQISAFLGASLAGFVLGYGNMKGVLIVNAATYASGALFFTMLTHQVNNETKKRSVHQQASKPKTRISNPIILWITFIGLMILTVQIAAFNFLIPIISQYEKSWTATQFGYIDAAAGLGAFLCTFIMTEKGIFSYVWLISFAMIILGDSLFNFITHQMFIIIAASFCIGFFVNSFRIKLRELMYESVATTQEIAIWTGRITAMAALIKAIFPLMLAYLTFHPSFNFMLCGLIIGVGLLVVEISYFIAAYRFSKNMKEEVLLNSARQINPYLKLEINDD